MLAMHQNLSYDDLTMLQALVKLEKEHAREHCKSPYYIERLSDLYLKVTAAMAVCASGTETERNREHAKV